MDLSEFLLARVAEDEETARDAALTVGWDGYGDQRIRSGQRWNPSYHVVKRVRDEGPTDRREVATCAPLFGMSTAEHIARWDPARVLAECEAKRRIVAWHRLIDGLDTEDHPIRGCCNCIASGAVPPYLIAGPCTTLRLLALPYVDHPDYDPAWRP